MSFSSYRTLSIAPLLLAAFACSRPEDEDGGGPTSDGTVTTGGVSTGGGLLTSGGGAAGGSTNAGGSVAVQTGGSAAGGGGGASGGAEMGTGGRTEPLGPHGFFPYSVQPSDATAAYEAWKAVHLEDCSGGVYRVRWENAKLDSTVSEGIGYGMLLSVIHNDQTAFDGLFAYSKLMRNGNQLMNWLRYGCDAHSDKKYNMYPDGAAADADLDVAMALLMAECKWSQASYGDEARTVIHAIKDHMFIDDSGHHLLIPGDSSWYHDFGAGCVNYSYFAPGYYRAFAEHDDANKDYWNQAADDTYFFLANASDPTTGLVRNWGAAGGGDAPYECVKDFYQPGSYGDDAARTPWRVATDYLWYGTPAAKTWSDKLTAWVKTVGIKNTVQWYKLDGTLDTEAPAPEDHTVINTGGFAVAAMTLDQATVDEFAAEVIAIPAGEGDHDGEYFPRMLKSLYLATLTGEFTTCGGN